MTRMSQARIDVRRKTYNKLIRWHLDAFDDYEMFGLSDEQAAEDVLTILLNMVLTSCSHLGMDADKLCYVIRKGFAERQSQSQ